MVSPTAFLAGDMAGSLALFAADKKKPASRKSGKRVSKKEDK